MQSTLRNLLVVALLAAAPGRVLALGADAFLANPAARDARLSPDGKRIALIATLGGKEILLVWDLARGTRKAILRFPDPDAQLAWVEWANDRRLVFSVDIPLVWSIGVRARSRLLYGIDRDGDNVRHLGKKWFGRGGRGKGIAPAGEDLQSVPIQFEDRVVDLLEKDADHILVALIKPGDNSPGVYRVDVRNGRLKRVIKPQEGVQTWLADHDGVVRAGVGHAGNRTRVIARRSADEDFFRIADYERYKEDSFQPLGFGFDRSTLYVLSPREGGRNALYEFDLDKRVFRRKLFAHPRVDVAGPLRFDRARRVLTAVEFVLDGPEVHFFDDEAARAQAAVDHALPGRWNQVVAESRDGKRALVLSSAGNAAPRCYLHKRAERAMDELFSEYPSLDAVALAQPEAVAYTARDGLVIHAILTRPPGAPRQRLPVIVYPHGGPNARDAITFDGVVQYFAHRGFAVFQPNFRGSMGYGDPFEAAGYQRWGLEMQDDISDGVQWLVAQKIADPARVGIYGASYGGYAALMGLVKTPALFRAGASWAGVTDLITLVNDDQWYRFGDDTVAQVGSTWFDRSRLKETSPAYNSERIRAPVLIGHGADDPRVHVKQARALAADLERAGKKVELVVYPDEVHGLRSEHNRIDFHQRLGDFFAAQLRAPGAAPSTAETQRRQ